MIFIFYKKNISFLFGKSFFKKNRILKLDIKKEKDQRVAHFFPQNARSSGVWTMPVPLPRTGDRSSAREPDAAAHRQLAKPPASAHAARPSGWSRALPGGRAGDRCCTATARRWRFGAGAFRCSAAPPFTTKAPASSQSRQPTVTPKSLALARSLEMVIGNAAHEESKVTGKNKKVSASHHIAYPDLGTREEDFWRFAPGLLGLSHDSRDHQGTSLAA